MVCAFGTALIAQILGGELPEPAYRYAFGSQREAGASIPAIGAQVFGPTLAAHPPDVDLLAAVPPPHEVGNGEQCHIAQTGGGIIARLHGERLGCLHVSDTYPVLALCRTLGSTSSYAWPAS